MFLIVWKVIFLKKDNQTIINQLIIRFSVIILSGFISNSSDIMCSTI